MAATSPRDRLLRALLVAAAPAVGLSAYACDDGPSAGEAPGTQLAAAGAAGTDVTAGSGGSSPTAGGAGGSLLGTSGAGGASTGGAGTGGAGTGGTSATSGSGGSSPVAGGAAGSSPAVGGAGGSSPASGGASGSSGSSAGTGGASGSSAGTAGSAGALASTFPPVPQGTGGSPTGYPQCGPDQTKPPGAPLGFIGSCCVDLYCIPLVDGACPAANTVYRGEGTGTCSCDTTSGPYDPGDAKPVKDSKGTACCYLAGIIGCDGRPLLIAGVARVAVLAVSSRGWT